jgi:hypothetical protein
MDLGRPERAVYFILTFGRLTHPWQLSFSGVNILCSRIDNRHATVNDQRGAGNK